MMHEIISRIARLEDLDDAVEKRLLAGEITADQKNEISEQLRKALSGEPVRDWYSGKYEVLNETQLLHPAFGVSRPDRVMLHGQNAVVVDYKFGDTEEQKHIRQVRHYVRLIKEMGYNRVKGYLFYVKSGKVIEVGLN